MELIKHIKYILFKKEMGVKELTEKLGISRSLFYLWSQGKCTPTLTHIYKMAKILKCSKKELVDLRNRDFRNKRR